MGTEVSESEVRSKGVSLSSLLPIAYCLLPIAYCLLPIAYCLLPIAYCLHFARVDHKDRN